MAAKKTNTTKPTELTTTEEVAKEVVKSKNKTYRNSPVVGDGGSLFTDDAEKAQFVRRTLTNALTYFDRKPVKSDEEAIERLNDYFKDCAEKGERPTVEEMALALGVTRNTLWDWETGRTKTVNSVIIKKAKEILANFDAKAVAEGKLNPVTYIFRSKNYYGMKDQQDINIAPVAPLGAEESTEKLENKYAESVIDTTGTDI